MDEDDDALQAELLRTFDKALADLIVSEDVYIDYFALPSGATAFQLSLSSRARDILAPLASPLGQSVDDLIRGFAIERACQPSLESH